MISNSGLKFEDVKAIYGHTNQQIENRLTKVSYFFFVKFSPTSLILPNFIVSFLNYFATDLGNDAFVLPIFMWFPFECNQRKHEEKKTQKRIPKQLLDFVKLHTDAKQLSPNAQGAVSIHS